MTKTELFFLPAYAEHLSPDLKQELEQNSTQNTQSTNVLESHAWLWRQVEDPNTLVTIAEWKSNDSRHAWFSGEEGKGSWQDIKRKVAQIGRPEAASVDGAMFTTTDSGLTALLSSPVISIGRLSITADNKAAFYQRWLKVKGLVEEHARPFTVKGAWNTSVADDSALEWIMVCGWRNVEQHMAFANTDAWPTYKTLLDFIAGASIKHYAKVGPDSSL